ncbi:hypothetical protein RQP46_006077 [Phenoliferia psychrophenolica]
MASLSSLAVEILIHILHLSSEGESAKEQQRNRIAFGLVSRAFYLATADTTDFYVGGQSNADRLFSILDLEKKENRVGREEGQATTPLGIACMSNIRRLTLIVGKEQKQDVFARLLEVLPNLIGLHLRGHDDRCADLTILEPLEAALRRLIIFYLYERSTEPSTSRIALHKLYTLKILIIPLVANLRHFAWSPSETQGFKKYTRDAVLSLLGATPKLESIRIPLQLSQEQEYRIEGTSLDDQPIDPSPFETLATLPLLHTVELVVGIGRLDENHVVKFIEGTKSLRFLSVAFLVDDGGTPWTPQERETITSTHIYS